MAANGGRSVPCTENKELTVTMHSYQEALQQFDEVGYVESIAPGIVGVRGLPGAVVGEVVVFADESFGQILSLSEDGCDVLLFSKKLPKVTDTLARTGQRFSIGVDERLLGSTIDAAGIHIDAVQSYTPKEYREVDRAPHSLQERTALKDPLRTGVSIADLVVPLAKGQRELVLGERKSGKSSFVMQTLATQAREGTVCIYCAVGNRSQDSVRLRATFAKLGIEKQTILVSAPAGSSLGMQYIAPYSAMAIAEYFRDLGKDSIVVFDDLGSHAQVYREICLLLRRFPGRNSYPADIFYTHARLLERGGAYRSTKGTVTISCLPIIDSIGGDLTSFITTNLMSMTDGHIYFDTAFFDQGRRPAINPFLSVTRVGLQAETPLYRDVSRKLTEFLVYFEQMRRYSHFGAEVSREVREAIGRGERLFAAFGQFPQELIEKDVSLFLTGLIWVGVWAQLDQVDLRKEIRTMRQRAQTEHTVRQAVGDCIRDVTTFEAYCERVRGICAKIGVSYDQSNNY